MSCYSSRVRRIIRSMSATKKTLIRVAATLAAAAAVTILPAVCHDMAIHPTAAASVVTSVCHDM